MVIWFSSKFGATKCKILTLKCTKFDFRWSSALDPAGGAYSAPLTLQLVLRGLLLRGGRGEEGKREGKGRWRDLPDQCENCFLRAWLLLVYCHVLRVLKLSSPCLRAMSRVVKYMQNALQLWQFRCISGEYCMQVSITFHKWRREECSIADDYTERRDVGSVRGLGLNFDNSKCIVDI